MILFAGLTSFTPVISYAFEDKRVRLPKRLKRGDLIGVIAPGSAASEEQIEKGISQIKSLGFKVKEGKFLRSRHGYLGAKDQGRLEDLHSMFADSSVQGIWCIRGGYGCGRLLPMIDYRLVKKNPKPLIGYSDITALHNAIFQKTGLICFHGPNAQPEMTDYTRSGFEGMLMDGKRSIQAFEGESENDYQTLGYLHTGTAEGRLVGGNLSLLASMAGTEFKLDAKNKIVFLEDVGERPYRIDRMLTQLLQSSRLSEAAGIILGQFKNCEAKDLNTSLSLEACLKDRLGGLGIPVQTGFSFGHVDDQCTLPVGARVRMNTSSGVIEVLEGVVG
ncbi:MAG: LD-carboxypeptidase [Saprospiraceae bacterium]|nr:LD-carboxypeptidase [Saprospiraceae bacterium]